MVKKIVTTCYCDMCKREAKSYSFVYDRVADAAGGMENLYYDVDLCSSHFAELVRKHGRPDDHRLRLGRSSAIAYGSKVKIWAEMQIKIWAKMSNEERGLALAIMSE